MHKHRLCLPATAEAGDPYPSHAQGWKPGLLPVGWNRRWRANGAYHNKHNERLQRLRKRMALGSLAVSKR